MTAAPRGGSAAQAFEISEHAAPASRRSFLMAEPEQRFENRARFWPGRTLASVFSILLVLRTLPPHGFDSSNSLIRGFLLHPCQPPAPGLPPAWTSASRRRHGYAQ